MGGGKRKSKERKLRIEQNKDIHRESYHKGCKSEQEIVVKIETDINC